MEGIVDLAQRYEAAAPTWEGKIARLGYPTAYAHLIEAAPVSGRVLDIGCGSGALAAAALARHGPRIAALTLADPSAGMLADAARRFAAAPVPVRTVRAGIGAPAFAPGAADTILCAHVIEHLDDPAAALRWLAGRLAPGGRLVLAVSRPHWCTALLRWVWGHRAYRPDAVLAMLAAAGLTGARPVPFPAGPPSRTSCGYLAQRARPTARPVAPACA
ncbi:methyltransferase domain-containing protein [Rhodobacteraceae bacterium CCMM004]|nr:methyltransferase domain-containing protein [Rhodobacteraceae bacterium CCMM004]